MDEKARNAGPLDGPLRKVLGALSSGDADTAALLANEHTPLIAFTAHRLIVAANRPGAAFFGYRPEELEGQSTDVIVAPRYRQPDAPPQPFTPDLTTVELPGLHREGHEIPTAWTFGAALTSHGPLFVLTVRNLEEAARELASLRRSDGRYHSLLMASAAVVWVSDPTGEILERQPTWEAYTGQRWEDYRGDGWITAVHPDDRAAFSREWVEARRTGAAISKTQGRIWSQSHRTWRACQARAVPVLGSDGTVLEWIGAITDVQDAFDAQERAHRRETELEARFRAIYENTLDGIALMDDSLRLIDVNPAACRLLGRSRDELIGMASTELMPPAKRQTSAQLLEAFRATGVMKGEEAVLLPDGTIRRAEFGAVADISPGLHLSTFRDIEDRKREQEGQAFLQEATALLTASLDFDETIASVCRLAVPRIADWATVDMREADGSLRLVSVVHVDPARVHLAYELNARQKPSLSDPTGAGAVIRTGKAELIPLVTDDVLVAALAKNPDLLPVVRGLGLRSAMTVPLTARGEVIGAISFISAESRRRYSEADLALAQELSRRATHALENAMFVRDLRAMSATKDLLLQRTKHLQATATELVLTNDVDAIVRAFSSGEPRSPVSARAWALFMKKGERVNLLCATADLHAPLQPWAEVPLAAEVPVASAIRTGQSFWFEKTDDVRSRFPGVETYGSSLVAGAGAGAVLPLNAGDDVQGALTVIFDEEHTFDTDERAYLTAIAHLWAQALHRARLAEAEREAIKRALEAETISTRKKDEFLAMLGHELRNPLAPIVTATSLMRLRGGVTSREIEILERQARHLVRLVDDLLDISRITAGKLALKNARVSVAEVLVQAVESTSPLYDERQVRLRFEADRIRRDLTVDGDRDRLVQVVSNVLINAAKFTPSDRNVFLTVDADAATVAVSVRDEGKGIEPALLPSVFDIFAQGQQASDRRTGGLGLGLTIAKSIVEAHRGRISIASPGVGLGTTVSLVLPRAVGASAEKTGEGHALVSPGPARRGRRVLIVDDNEESAELLSAFLTASGYQCFVAGDGRRALALSQEARPDVAIVDIGLPDIDGHQLARELRALPLRPAPKLIALTGYAQDRDRVLAAEAGFSDHLAKPVEMSTLTTRLEALLRAEAHT